MMGDSGVDPALIAAWLTARLMARGLPAPVSDYGGYRVDVKSETEISRWVFPHITSGLVELGRTIEAPRYLLKLCGAGGELLALLPGSWKLHAPGYFMAAREVPREPLPAGYTIKIVRNGGVTEVRLISSAGDLAASGYAAETQDAFIYDRIVTAPEHRRRGLAKTVMAALHSAKVNPETPQLLVATEEGRALYLRLGWQTLSPYCTASIPGNDGL